MKKRIMALVSVILIFGIIGCVSYTHTQAVRNEIGNVITEVYIRDTGTANWGSVKNVQARKDSEGNIIRNRDGTVASWDRVNMNNGTQVVFFREISSSETPSAMKNQDILVVDTNGIRYAKFDVSIVFTTTKSTDIFIMDLPSQAITTSDPITFTAQDRLPMLFVVNQTGYTATLVSPAQGTLAHQQRTQFQPSEVNQSINVTYSIGQARYTEQVTMSGEDTTVTLTRRPPTITIVNNVGATINTIFMRIPGSPSWTGGNIVIRSGTVFLADGAAQAGELSGSIVNRDSMRLWLGNVNLSGDTFDVRIDDVQGNTYVKSNVRVTSDMSLTFTQADKR